MKPKNIMLLGFVNKAVDYLEKHMDEEPDTRLAELKNIDLASIREELSDYLDSSLGTMQSTMSTLLKAGNEAFDQFIEENHKENISDQFNRMFDVDLNDTSKTNQEDLAKLLSFYNLEDFDAESGEEIDLPILEDVSSTSSDDVFMDEIKKNITNDDVQDILPIADEQNNKEIDSIFTEIVEHEANPSIEPTKLEAPAIKVIDEIIENAQSDSESDIKEVPIDEPVEELKVEEAPVEETKAYVNTLIDELREQMIKEDEIKKEQDSKDKEIYEKIHSIYPYLPEVFVKSAYELKQSLANEYPEDIDLIVLHRVSFNNVDDLRKFVEIGLNHNYTINADENKLIVDILKEFINSDGKILNNIFEIANQGFLLNGNYEGYNIIVNE